jgi:hypothetical protein
MQKESCHRKGKESPAYLDPHMMMRTQIVVHRQAIVKYLVREARVYSDNEMLIIPYNTGNQWILVSISSTHDQVWYCVSNRLTGLILVSQFFTLGFDGLLIA